MCTSLCAIVCWTREGHSSLAKEEETMPDIVLKLGSPIDSAGVLGHWVNGRTTESLVEPHDRTRLNRITWLDDSA